MIRNSTKEFVKKAEDKFDNEPSHFSKDYAKYGMLQNLIDIVVNDCIDTIKQADLRDITFTTYDMDKHNSLRERFAESIKEKYGNKLQ